MLSKLLDVILQFIEDVIPAYTIPIYEKGVRLRNGKPRGGFGLWCKTNENCVLEAGWHWKWSFFDKILTHSVIPSVMELDSQSITTTDNIKVVAHAVLKYEVSDIQTFLLKVNSAKDALSDMSEGIIFNKISTKTWSECRDGGLLGEISRAAKAEAKKWGITILDVTFKSLSEIPSYRLIIDKNTDKEAV